MRGRYAPVALYHSAFKAVPVELQSHLHNIRPEVLFDQMRYLRDHFDIVPLDHFLTVKRAFRLAAITFDDGYKSVHEHAFPILKELKIPFAIFINGATLQKRLFWRDKVRLIVNHQLISEFESQAKSTKKIPGLSFYRYTKDLKNNSVRVHEEIDQFLAAQKITSSLKNHCMEDTSEFIRSPLITYGNHSHDHYLLASLTEEQQRDQIYRTHSLLQSISGIKVSKFFSIPFGGLRSFNESTVQILKSLDYKGILLSRNHLNFGFRNLNGLRVVERFMPDDEPMSVNLDRILGRDQQRNLSDLEIMAMP
ncbi:polysaccharide deacetylase family protein [Candidatus Acetothermia bacterium]|nr:polysaccharide deacetylase family protein [Candidatus Acetothermia bacterium]MBI3643586.1 polysaccharide deacetylase family protein [Candidatus Acetothermia bacterium]